MSIADIKPHEDYAMLVKQFNALKNVLICKEKVEASRHKEWKTDEVARKTLDSEREANAKLTEEVERLQKERDYAVRWANKAVDDVKEALFAENDQLRTALRDLLPYAVPDPTEKGGITIRERAARLLGGQCSKCGGTPEDHVANYYCPEFKNYMECER